MAETAIAAQMRPAGVVRAEALMAKPRPIRSSTPAFISSGCGAALDEPPSAASPISSGTSPERND